jgi:hypothetical protein
MEKCVMLEVIDSKFTDDQKAYIRKYAAGLLVAWIGPEIQHLITPTIMDGFEPPKGIFPDDEDGDNDEDYMLDGAGEVLEILDNWFDEVARIAGFKSGQEAWEPSRDDQAVYAKYPVMK